VFKARSNTTGAFYAIKFIPKSSLQTETLLQNLIEEVKTMRLLDNPNVVKLHAIYETEDLLALVLDYIPDGDLFKLIVEQE
jgi:calcium/calmodulin-dependent protein kinase I